MFEGIWYPVVWWIITAVIFFIFELTTASFFFLWIGAGAVVTAILSVFVDTPWIQYTTFAVSSILLVAVSRRWASRISGPSKTNANVDSLVGTEGVITKVEKNTPARGYVKVGGEHWMAESEDNSPLKIHGKVVVASVRSNVLVVKV